MERVKQFVKRHFLWMGLAAVLVPLLAHLWLQYRSLAELESTMPVARRAMMRNYLGMVTK